MDYILKARMEIAKLIHANNSQIRYKVNTKQALTQIKDGIVQSIKHGFKDYHINIRKSVDIEYIKEYLDKQDGLTYEYSYNNNLMLPHEFIISWV